MNNIINLLKKEVVFADAEYIHRNLENMRRPEKQHYKEVTQIGAAKYKNGNEIATFNMKVRPSIKGPKLSEKSWLEYKNITGVDKESVMECSNSFIDVWNKFTRFVDGNPIIIMLGDKDVYKWNFKLLEKIGCDVKENLDNMNFIKLKPLLDEKHQKYCSGELYKIVGLTSKEVSEGETHDALFDAKSMALFCKNYSII